MPNALGIEFYRDFPMEIRTETATPDGIRRLSGYASVFNTASELIGGQFREIIMPGAFYKTLQESDVVALWQHDTAKPIARRSKSTLRLQEDGHGLATEIDLPASPLGNDVYESVHRGDVQGMSFGFRVPKGKDKWAREDGVLTRRIFEVALIEVSPVTFPAYQATDIVARSIVEACAEASPSADGTTPQPGLDPRATTAQPGAEGSDTTGQPEPRSKDTTEEPNGARLQMLKLRQEQLRRSHV